MGRLKEKWRDKEKERVMARDGGMEGVIERWRRVAGMTAVSGTVALNDVSGDEIRLQGCFYPLDGEQDSALSTIAVAERRAGPHR